MPELATINYNSDKIKPQKCIHIFVVILCPRQESNLQLFLRTELLYPFNYRGNKLSQHGEII